MQLEVELLSSARQHIPQTDNTSSDNVGQVLFAKQEMGKIIEEDEEEAERTSEISHMV